MSRAYEYRHTVLFQETNLVGNVYFAHYVAWQGSCREQFLREHAPEILDELSAGLALVTVSCACEYLSELTAFDTITIRMFLVEALQNRIDLRFEYIREGSGELVALGRQRVACMRRQGTSLVPTPIPRYLADALSRFA
jgi:enediyne core biosynthesis thioesterase